MNAIFHSPAPKSRLRHYLLVALDHPHFLIICFAIYLALRAAIVFIVPSVEPTSDAAWYFGQGTKLSEGLGYQRNGGPTAYWPIGYPAFLAAIFYLFGPSVLVASTANLALSAISFFLLYATASQIFREERIPRLSTLLFALYPNSIGHTGLVLSETLFTTLLLFACWSYIRQSNYSGAITSGLAFGLATLVKTQAVLIPVILVGFAFVFVRPGRFSLSVINRGVVVVFVMLLTVAPWTYRNYQVFGEFVLVSTNGGVSLLAGNNPAMKSDFQTDFVFDQSLENATGHPKAPEIKVNKEAKRLATNWIRKNPDRFIALTPHKLWRLWAPDGESEWGYQAMGAFYDDNVLAFRTIRFLNQGYYATIVLAAIAFPLVYRRSKAKPPTDWIWLGYLLALYVSAISIVFSGQSRYHFPVMPFLMINASYVLVYLSLRQRRSSVNAETD